MIRAFRTPTLTGLFRRLGTPYAFASARSMRRRALSRPRMASVSKQTEADRLASQRDTQRMDNVANLDPLGRDEFVDQLLQRRRLERLTSASFARHFANNSVAPGLPNAFSIAFSS